MDIENSRIDWRAHWRLIFNVIDGVARMRQEITIWQKDISWPAAPLARLAYDIKTLAPTNLVSVMPGPDWVQFNNGFIEYQTDLDKDIRDLVTAAGLGTPQTLEGIAVPIDGENIFIRADISLENDSSMVEHPVFYFPQTDPRGVQLAEIYDSADDSRRMKWIISGQIYRSQGAFRLESFQGRHGLRVRQGRDKRNDLFSFYADSIPIDSRFTQPSHSFLPGVQTFFLGTTPDHPDGFTGKIYHLEFDPNNSCATCPQPTSIEPEQD